ncbi:MAG TPA: type IV secretion system DNA-binding domain-containing protein [Candidatus Pacearchaeota archaeon]|nr:type IV secretion system DNA-binding domain-containing protein [Candidatus Pacearchaeota archaeon]HOL90320.1 type IV secretion system DNA-binding domain-containing protein [Candidatus Pacearchaeota archaeon]HPO68506.1 type IV secretion system DNA-binding domain-containing protein [Candidatus Pacearchaeota archaeon]
MKVDSEINYFGETTFRNIRKKFGIKTDDRRRHMYIIGKTGMGKTEMIKNMAIQDIIAGKGMGFVDPHGEAAEELLDYVPSNRINDVIYFNPADIDYPIAFNVMEKVDIEHRHLVASGLMGVFKKIWPDVWSARMEYILNNTILSLLEYPGATLLGINRMLSDVEFRKKVIENVTDPIVKSFWVNEFSRYSQTYEVEATAAIQNKIGQFVSNPLIRNIVGQVKSSIDMRKIMDEGKILILNLSKGKVGEDNSMLLGALLITKLQLAAMSRVDIPEEKRKDFYLYVDEFQNFVTESFAEILSEARKYRLCLILAHQYISQLEEMTATGKSTKVKDAVFGNVGTIISFRVGAEDAEFLEKEFLPVFTAQDLVNLPKYHIYLKLMINGIAAKPFSAVTLPPFEKPLESNKEKIIKVSRERYGTPREKVEESIQKWIGFIPNMPVNIPKKETLYNAKCSSCGKNIKLIFKPEENKPVYCKSCLKKIKDRQNQKDDFKKELSEKEEIEKKEFLSLEEAIKEKSVNFKEKKVNENKEEKEKKKPEVDVEDLKKTIKESISKFKNLKNNK